MIAARAAGSCGEVQRTVVPAAWQAGAEKKPGPELQFFLPGDAIYLVFVRSIALQTLFAHTVRMQAVTLALSLAAVLLCTSASPLKTEAHFNTDVFTADNTHATQKAVETAEPAAPKFDTSVFSAAEWTEDAAPVETIPLRRYSSGSSTSSGVTPPPPPPPAKKITQAITLPYTAAQYTGVTKTLNERGYGLALGIFDTSKVISHPSCRWLSSTPLLPHFNPTGPTARVDPTSLSATASASISL